MLTFLHVNVIIIIIKGCLLSVVSTVSSFSSTIKSTEATSMSSVDDTTTGYTSTPYDMNNTTTLTIVMSTNTTFSTKKSTSTDGTSNTNPANTTTLGTSQIPTNTKKTTTKPSTDNDVRDFVIAITAMVFVVIFIISVVGFICHSLGYRSAKRKQFKSEIAALRKRKRSLKDAETKENRTEESQKESQEIESPYSLAKGDDVLMIKEEEISEKGKKKTKSVKFSKTKQYNVSDGLPSNSDKVTNVNIQDDDRHYIAKNKGVSHVYTLSVKAKGDTFRLIENEEDIAKHTENCLRNKDDQSETTCNSETTSPNGVVHDAFDDDDAYADASSEDIKAIKRRSTPISGKDFGYVDIRKSVPILSTRESKIKSRENSAAGGLSDSNQDDLFWIYSDSTDNEYDDTQTVTTTSDTYDSTKDNPYDITEHENAKRRVQIKPDVSKDNNYDHVELPPSLPSKPYSYEDVNID